MNHQEDKKPMKLRFKNDFLTTYIVRNELPVDFLPIWKFKSCKISSTYDAADIIVEIGGILSKLFNKSDWQQSR